MTNYAQVSSPFSVLSEAEIINQTELHQSPQAVETLEARLIEAFEDALHDGLEPSTAVATAMQWLAVELLRSGCEGRFKS